MTAGERTHPPHSGSEAETLFAFLDMVRETMRIKTSGLNAEQLDARLEPSTMTLGGMIKHLAFVEDWWFSKVLHGNQMMPPFDTVDWDADWDWEWHTAADDTPEELHELLDRAVAHSRELVAGIGIEDPATTPDRAGNPISLRWILVHMIEEYARHNGHADLLRESIDGATGD